MYVENSKSAFLLQSRTWKNDSMKKECSLLHFPSGFEERGNWNLAYIINQGKRVNCYAQIDLTGFGKGMQLINEPPYIQTEQFPQLTYAKEEEVEISWLALNF